MPATERSLAVYAARDDRLSVSAHLSYFVRVRDLDEYVFEGRAALR
jgi:hypothetical protein